ncbi:glycosyltransferase family 4 protein [Arthrobacter sp. Bz4]|uniref:glycosyltransferase family 4 protein n=1 Tax=Arthrobacter sp. Bz4 TaxID=2171979 RepID=UPI001402766F|nr:glycosyltransferase family 4 protein [Arthrobacter sp. Bz4]
MTAAPLSYWSGLHENVYYSALALKNGGYQVTVACPHGQLDDALTKISVDTIGIDWDDWKSSVGKVRDRSFDLVYTHPFRSRKLGMNIAQYQSIPMVSHFHGRYLDSISLWKNKVSRVICVSEGHAKYMQAGADVADHTVSVVRNGVLDKFAEVKMDSLDSRTSDGKSEILVLSRVDPDKYYLLDALTEAISGAVAIRPDLHWVVRLAGGGTAVTGFEERIKGLVEDNANVTMESLGWVPPAEVPSLISSSSMVVASGRGAALSLALGTPVIAAGSKGIAGLQYGNNLEAGAWGNFGGMPSSMDRFQSIRADVRTLFGSPDFYKNVSVSGREYAKKNLLQSISDNRLRKVCDEIVR